jgi:hypothetical protein
LDILMRALIATVDILAAASIKVTLAKDNWFCDTTDLGETQWGHGYVLREPAAMPAAPPVAGPEDLGASRASAS